MFVQSLFVSLKKWNNRFYFWTVFFLKFLVHPFSPFTFCLTKKKPNKLHFFNLFLFHLLFQHFSCLLFHHCCLCSLSPFIFLFIYFCFSPLFFSLFSPFFLFLYLSVSLSLFSVSHVSLSDIFSIAVFAYPLFVLTHFSSLFCSWSHSSFLPSLPFIFFISVSVFCPNKFKIFCDQFFEDEMESLIFEPSFLRCFVSCFSSLRRPYSLSVPCFTGF